MKRTNQTMGILTAVLISGSACLPVVWAFTSSDCGKAPFYPETSIADDWEDVSYCNGIHDGCIYAEISPGHGGCSRTAEPHRFCRESGKGEHCGMNDGTVDLYAGECIPGQNNNWVCWQVGLVPFESIPNQFRRMPCEEGWDEEICP